MRSIYAINTKRRVTEGVSGCFFLFCGGCMGRNEGMQQVEETKESAGTATDHEGYLFKL